MKGSRVITLFCLSVCATGSYAQCSGTALTIDELQDFSGTTVTFDCVTNCADWMGSTNVDWHETHAGSGDLVEIGTGAGGVQPTDTVGSWEVSSTVNEICYTYTGDSTYCYTVYGTAPVASGNTYAFCSGSTHRANGTVD